MPKAKAKKPTKAQKLAAMQGLLGRKLSSGAVGKEAVLKLVDKPESDFIAQLAAAGEIEPDVACELQQALDG